MALRSGVPTAAGATALFVLTTQLPMARRLAPADFAVAGKFTGAAAVRVAPCPWRAQSAARIAVTLPAGYCGQAMLSLADPSLIRPLAGGGPGACADSSVAVSWVRVCGPAAASLVVIAGTELPDLASAGSPCHDLSP
jgi:hypothetical protein